MRTSADINKGSVYLVGNFVNGMLEGNGMEVTFHTTYINYKPKPHSEADFLLLTAYGQPDFKDVKALRPQVLKMGNFNKGVLNGKGILYAIETQKIPELLWIVDFAKRFASARSWGEIRYEGEFVNTEPAGRGQVIVQLDNGTLTTTGENLISGDNPDIVFELEKEGLPGKALFRGSFRKGFAHGWALTNFVNNQRTEGGKLVRQVWHYNWPGFATQPGTYPFDEAGSREYQPDKYSHYIVGQDAKGRATGFGRLVKLYNSAYKVNELDTAYIYTGYFTEGRPSGEGFLEKPFGEWKAGIFSTTDTLITGKAAFNEVIPLGRPNFFQQGIGYYQVYDGNELTPDGRIKGGTGTRLVYSSLSDYGRDKDISESYRGGFKDGKYHGFGVSSGRNYRKEGNWSYGNLVTGTGNTVINTNGLTENMVVVINGTASPVKRNPNGFGWVTADNRPVPQGEVTLSKLPLSRFYGACPVCSGSGKQSEAHYVAPSSKLDVKTVTTYTDASYVGGYWKNTSRVVTETTSGGYTYYTQKTCASCYGNKITLTVVSVPEP